MYRSIVPGRSTSRRLWLHPDFVKPALASLIVALVVIVAGPRGALAQEAANPWQPRLLVTPYLWLSGIYGTIARQQPGVNVDVGPFQVLGDLVGAPFMGSVEVRFGPIGLLGDVLHIPLSAPVSTRRQPRITAPPYMPDASEPPMRNRNSTG